MSDNIICRILDLPSAVEAVTVPNSDGTYNVYVNAKLSEAEQRSDFLHEVVHIEREHFYINKSVVACEKEAKEKSRQLKAAL